MTCPITLQFKSGELTVVSFNAASDDGKTFDLLAPGFGEKLEAWLVLECGLSERKAGQYIRQLGKALKRLDK